MKLPLHPSCHFTPFIPFPLHAAGIWEALPSSLKNRAVEDAKALCPVVWPQILACDFFRIHPFWKQDPV